MRNILIVRWYDVLHEKVLVKTLNGKHDYLDIVQSLRHIETKIQQIETWDED
jgi:hypothetical protein